jgi:hypothetical protein
MYDTSNRTPEEEQRLWERRLKLLPEMDELDYREGEYRPETTLNDQDIATVVFGGGRRK